MWEQFTLEFVPGGLIDESTTVKKDLAWLPATNDANEGALGSFCVLMQTQPQLTVINYNAITMFERNNTQAFMDAMFEDIDHQFIRLEGRKFKRKDREWIIEMVNKQEKQNADCEATKQRHQELAAKRKKLIESLDLEMDRSKIAKMTKPNLLLQVAAFKQAGAKDLQDVKPKLQVLPIKYALYAAITLMDDGIEIDDSQEPHLYTSQKIGQDEECESFNLDEVEDDEEEDWQDL
jgi:hypothetical protein